MIEREPVRIFALLCMAAIPVLAACPAAEEDDPAPGSTSAAASTSSGMAGSTSSGDPGTTAIDPDEGSTSTTTGEGESTGTTGGSLEDPGCPECIVLASGLTGGRGIALDVDHVYWTDQGNGSVHRILKGGGDGGMIALDQDQPYGISVSDGQVYWTNFSADGGVFRVPITGGAPTLLHEDAHPRSIVVSGDQIYWGTFDQDDGRLMRMPVARDEAATVLVSLSGGIADLVVDGDQVFFTAHTLSGGGSFIEPPPSDPPEGSVFATPPGGGPFDPFDILQLASDLAEPWGIAKQGDTLVWVDGMGDTSSHARSVLSMASAGGPIQTLADGQTAPWGVAVDEQYVYWTDHEEVWAVPLTGGEEILLAELQNQARSIVVDAQWVFWITRDRVLQRPKP